MTTRRDDVTGCFAACRSPVSLALAGLWLALLVLHATPARAGTLPVECSGDALRLDVMAVSSHDQSTVQRDRWMGQLLDEDPSPVGIGGTLLRDFIFPGTHDSGTYSLYTGLGLPVLAGEADEWYSPFISFGLLLGSPIVGNLSLTQSKSVYCQLWEGARSFDLRVVSDALGAFDLGLLQVFTVHTVVTAPMAEILNDLARFLGEPGHDAEIVFLNFEDKGAAGEKFLPSEVRAFLSQQLYQIPVGTSGQSLGDYLIEFQDDDVQEVKNRDSLTNALPYSLTATGDGSKTAYPYGFVDGGDGDCKLDSLEKADPPGEGNYQCGFVVTVGGESKAFSTDYSVDRVNNQITFTSAPANGAEVLIGSFYRPFIAVYITAGGGTRIDQAGPPESSNPAKGQVIITAPDKWRCHMNQANHADETCADQPDAPYGDGYSPDPGIFGGKNLKRVLWTEIPRTCCEFSGINGNGYPRVDEQPSGYFDEAGVRNNMQRVIDGRANPNPPMDEQMRVMGLHLGPDPMLADCLLDPSGIADLYSLNSWNCSARTIADFVAMNVIPQIVALKRRDVNIIHIDNYNPALTDEVYKLNKGAARVVAQITRAEDVGDDADGFPDGQAELYPRFLWWGSGDDYVGGMPRPKAAVETTRSLLADLYLMGTDLRLNETHSKYAYALRAGQSLVFTDADPRWASYRSFPLDSHPLLLVQLWDEDDGLAGADDLLCLASSEVTLPLLPCTEHKTLPVAECIHGDPYECSRNHQSQTYGAFDEIDYRVEICNWSSGECDGIVPPPPPGLPPIITSGGTTAEQCGSTDPGWTVYVDYLEVEYQYNDSTAPPVASIDWGDGTIDDVSFVPGAGAAGEIVTGTVSGSHVYATGGIFNVTVVVRYDSGGGLLTGVATLPALVSGARLAGGELQVVGSNGRDKVSIESWSGESSTDADNSGQNDIKLKLHLDQGLGWARNFELIVPAAEVGALRVLTCDGNDHIGVTRDVTASATLEGGADADKIHAGGGPSRISGGGDDDDLVGGSAVDFIDGGPGDYDRCRSKPGGADSFVNCEIP